MSSVATEEDMPSVAKEEMSSVATGEEMFSVATEEMSSVATEDISSAARLGQMMPRLINHRSGGRGEGSRGVC